VLTWTGCNGAGEGDRCNPLRSSDECGSGLFCSGSPLGLAAAHPIDFCPNNYCCPANVTPSDSANCQPGCNGGAADICAADAGDTAACAFASCVADASDPSTCVGADAATGPAAEGGPEAAAPAAEGGAEAAAPDGGGAPATD
jgi:hypothetical protein